MRYRVSIFHPFHNGGEHTVVECGSAEVVVDTLKRLADSRSALVSKDPQGDLFTYKIEKLENSPQQAVDTAPAQDVDLYVWQVTYEDADGVERTNLYRNKEEAEQFCAAWNNLGMWVTIDKVRVY